MTPHFEAGDTVSKAHHFLGICVGFSGGGTLLESHGDLGGIGPQVMAGIGPRRGRWIKWDGQGFWCISQMLHVWNAYLHLLSCYMANVGKYTIHGWYGICYLGNQILQKSLDFFVKDYVYDDLYSNVGLEIIVPN